MKMQIILLSQSAEGQGNLAQWNYALCSVIIPSCRRTFLKTKMLRLILLKSS